MYTVKCRPLSHLSRVNCHLTNVACQLSPAKCRHMSHVTDTCKVAHVKCDISNVTCQLSTMPYYLSLVKYLQMSPAICQLSCDKCHISIINWNDKWKKIIYISLEQRTIRIVVQYYHLRLQQIAHTWKFILEAFFCWDVLKSWKENIPCKNFDLSIFKIFDVSLRLPITIMWTSILTIIFIRSIEKNSIIRFLYRIHFINSVIIFFNFEKQQTLEKTFN